MLNIGTYALVSVSDPSDACVHLCMYMPAHVDGTIRATESACRMTASPCQSEAYPHNSTTSPSRTDTMLRSICDFVTCFFSTQTFIGGIVAAERSWLNQSQNGALATRFLVAYQQAQVCNSTSASVVCFSDNSRNIMGFFNSVM